MNPINEETTIANAILLKGNPAAKVIDNILCDGEKSSHGHCSEENLYCPGTSFKLCAAAKLKGKTELLPVLLQRLNRLPNIPCKRH